jgi:cytochrome P450
VTAPTPPVAVDPGDPSFHLDADALYAWLRAEAPVLEYAPHHFTVAKYHDIREISRDPERFCSGRGVLVNDPMRGDRPSTAAPSIIHMDPPDHTRFRNIVNRAFTPRAVRALEPRVRELAREVLDAVSDGRVVDLVETIAVPLPVLVIAELLGIPEEHRGDFRRWSDASIEAADHSDERTLREIGELFAFLRGHLDRARAHPAADLVSALVQAEVDGRRLTDDELVVFCMALLVAGNETTRHLVSGGALALARHPEQRSALAADLRSERVAVAVEEMLRVVTPVSAFARTATRPTTLRGTQLAAGDYVVMLYASGNRDEEVFGLDADAFDAQRPPDPAHVAFGFGEHLCLGASLARLEARVMFEELLARHPRYEVVGEPAWLRSTVMHGLVTLPVALDG